MNKRRAIWLFAGGPMQEIAAKEIIRRDYRLIVTDRNPDCVCSKYADEVIDLDTFDIEGNLRTAKQLKNKYRIEAVLTVAADCHESVAHVGTLLGLPVISPDLSHRCRHKDMTKKILSEAGIPQPRFFSVSHVDEAKRVVGTLGGKAVLKATDNSGSRGFHAVDRIDDLTDEIFERALSAGTTKRVLIEERLDPVENEIAEQSVETLWYDGKMYWLNWVDRLFRKDYLFFDCLKSSLYSQRGWGVELGHINPAIHDGVLRRSVFDLMYRAGLAMGMGREKGGHIFKGDIMLTPKGPFLLEVTPRLSGGWDSSKSTVSRGGDFIGGAISLALGNELTLDLWMRHFQYQNPNLFSSVLADNGEDAVDCIGRVFAEGSGDTREESLANAYKNLTEGRLCHIHGPTEPR